MSKPRGYQRFFAELKRRKVFRVMAVYGAVAFGVLQVADIALPGLGLPEWTITLVLALTFLGFPLAVVLAWAFETTPEGMKRTAKADPGEITQIVAAPAANRWPVGLAAAGGTALFLIGAWLALGRPIAGGEASGARAERTASEAPAEASIAVLPFANLSQDADTQPFVDGVHDDLLTQLSKIADLTVISRTSVLEYRDSPKNVREIAGELGVATVMEGGVQRAGSRFRINVQLIDAGTDAHLWAEQYEGELTAENIFDVQTRIATSIAEALEANLTAGERANLERLPTEDLEAYELYRRAREEANVGVAEVGYRTADRLIDRAIERDSSFAEAWAMKSIVASYLYWFYFDRSDSIVAVADELSRHALELSPGLAEGHWARGHYYYRTQLDYPRATEEIERALRARPGDADFEGLAGDILRRKGDTRGAASHYERAVKLAPRDAQAHITLGETYILLRDCRAAQAVLERAIELRPDVPAPYHRLAQLQILSSGDTSEAGRWLREVLDVGAYDQRAEFGSFELAMLERNPGAAQAALARRPEGLSDNQFHYHPRALSVGLVRRLAGDTAAARTAFDSARVILEALVERDPTEPRYRSALGLALAGLGREEEAIREGREGLRLMPPEREAWRGAWRVADLARIYSMTGRPDEAVDQLVYLLSVPSEWTAWDLRLDPIWDPLRGNARFEKLAAGE